MCLKKRKEKREKWNKIVSFENFKSTEPYSRDIFLFVAGWMVGDGTFKFKLYKSEYNVQLSWVYV